MWLTPGARVAIVAPSGPAMRQHAMVGLAWLGQRYRLSMRTRALSKTGYMAGPDDARAAELAAAMLDPEVRAIFCLRGGYGLTRILDRLPWSAFARAPKPICGFSDVTALHVRAGSLGVPSVHAPNVTGVGVMSPSERLALLRALERGRTALGWRLAPLRAGDAEGPLAGGNLALLCAMAAAGEEVVPAGAIVIVEDVMERPYRVDRMLTSLLRPLSRASAVVFGELTDCKPNPDGVTVEDVLADFAARVPSPVWTGAPVGHGARNEPFVLGARARLRGGVLSPA